MQKIHDKVTVFVTPRELQRRSAETDGACASTTALQYVAENAGFDVVTFRVDFSQSASIKLHRLDAASRSLQKATLEMAFECELQPFERQVLVYLVKKRRKRAFVRCNGSDLRVHTNIKNTRSSTARVPRSSSESRSLSDATSQDTWTSQNAR